MARMLTPHQIFSWIASRVARIHAAHEVEKVVLERRHHGPRQELAAGEAVAGDALVGRDLAEHDTARDDVLGEQRQRHLDVMRRSLDADDFHRFPPIAPGHTMLQ